MAELIAASTALGVVSSLISIGDAAWKVVARLQEYNTHFDDAPKILRKISNQLPLLHETFSKWKEETEAGSVIIDDGSALKTVIIGCNDAIESLGLLLEKVLPKKTDSKTVRLMKAFRSVKYESEMSKLWADIESYRGTLILHFTHREPTVPKDAVNGDNISLMPKLTRYMYPNRLVNHYVDRCVDGVPLIERIDSHFAQNGEGRSRVAVLSGMGGSGKSQIALRYCEYARGKGNFRAIFWVDVSSAKSVAKAYEEISEALTGSQPAYSLGSAKLSTSMTGDKKESPVSTQQIVESAKVIIQSWGIPWMFVFDNYDQPDEFQFHGSFRSIRDYWPAGGGGAVLITSRHQSCERLGKTFYVGRMSSKEASLLLFNHIEDEEEENQKDAAADVVELLGYLALAVDQAGAYIRSRNLKISLYPEHYKSRKEHILKRVPSGSEWEYRRKFIDTEEDTALSVFTTWELSLNCISGIDIEIEQKLHFLNVAAFLDTSNIQEALFREHFRKSPENPSWTALFSSQGQWDTYKFGDLIAELKSLSILESLEHNEQGSRFTFHPLVGEWIRVRLSPALQDAYTTEAVFLLHHNLPRLFRVHSEGKSVADLQALIPHVTRCLQNCTEFHLNEHCLGIEELEDPGASFSEFLSRWAMYDEAEMIELGRLKWGEQHDKPWTKSSIKAGIRLIWIYREKYKSDLVRKWTPEILSRCQQLLGDDDELTLACQTLSEMMYLDMGNLEEAERVLEANYAKKCSVMGPDNSHTICTRGNLAIAYHRLGKKSMAISHTSEALDALRKTLGPDDLSTLQMQKFLVWLLFQKPDEALPLALDCVSRSEKRLGTLHPRTIESYFNLVRIYYKLNRLEDNRKVLNMIQKVLEPFSSVRNDEMAELYGQQAFSYDLEGNHDMSDIMFAKSIAKFKEMNAIHGQDCLICINRLSRSYARQGKGIMAEKFWKEAISSYERSGEQRGETEEDLYKGYYALLSYNRLYEDTSRKAEIRAVADSAIQAASITLSWKTYRLHLCIAQVYYSFLGEPLLVDEASSGLLDLADARFGTNGRLFDKVNDFHDTYALALQVPLPLEDVEIENT